MSIAADFKCLNVPLECAKDNESMEKLSVNKPVAIGYIIVKNPDFDNLNLAEDIYNKHFGEDCVEKFINEMLQKEICAKVNLKIRWK